MVAQNAPLRERLAYLQRHIPNLPEVADGALAQLRERFRVPSAASERRAS
jgi:hypothetical protein